MNRSIIYCLMLVLLASCGSKENTQTRTLAIPDVQTDGTTHRMSDYYYTDTVTWHGEKYEYSIVRLADDSLGVVTDTDGMKYVNNTLSLTVSRGGHRIFERAFSKQSLSQYIDSRFLAANVIEGMAFNRVSEEGLRFSISVGLPLSDEYVQLCLTVRPDGSYDLCRDEVVDENLIDDADAV